MITKPASFIPLNGDRSDIFVPLQLRYQSGKPMSGDRSVTSVLLQSNQTRGIPFNGERSNSLLLPRVVPAQLRNFRPTNARTAENGHVVRKKPQLCDDAAFDLRRAFSFGAVTLPSNP